MNRISDRSFRCISGIRMLIPAFAALCFITGGCASSQGERAEFTLAPDSIEWKTENPSEYENSLLRITLVRCARNSDLLHRAVDTYITDGGESAKSYLLNNYDLCLLTMENLSEAKQTVCLEKIRIGADGTMSSPISPSELPSVISRGEMSALSKNVISAVSTAALTAALAASVAAGRENSPSASADFQKENYWAALRSDTKFVYENLIGSENEIPPLGKKSGVIFLGKSALGNHALVDIEYLK